VSLSTEAVPVPQEPARLSARGQYVRAVLSLYRATPGVLGRVRNADRTLAGQLYDQGIPLYLVANAFVVAAARRQTHNAFSSPLPPIRSLHYFLGVIRELLERPLGPRDIDELRRVLRAADPTS
jgi:hypothetical protein